ncbi:leucyl-tRNA synthetase [Tieghemostelium lacteum]|uniref:Lysine--tRNA ligase n=1 Tax=Tieghemostelium lacteum TaxID=361077 RepID=A0A151Z4B9_TIELA|nr:leucyl-tRNA synthetase [Tieghemostelium lacteum]|eukprot:KYQ88791.1 leucyl-tRNA synthetase [Tieghemostelium lacteum]
MIRILKQSVKPLNSTFVKTLIVNNSRRFFTQNNKIIKEEINEEDLESTAYLEQYHHSRDEMMKQYQKETPNRIYSAESRNLSHSIPQFREIYQDHLKPGEKLIEVNPVTVAGRIKSIRISSAKLFFIDLIQDDKSLQLMVDLKFYENTSEYQLLHQILRKGDIIECSGIPAKSKLGELSIIPKSIQILTPCLRPIPLKLQNKEMRYRNRPLDFIVNPSIKNAFLIRSKMISFLRNYLVDKEFIEVDTPILSTNVGGANAKPFKTHSNSLNLDLFLRISPELFLKQLVISGFDKVFEIGKQFRNEGIDLTHNPEFTTCELYQAYADYNSLVLLTEDLLSKMILHTVGSYKIPLPSNPEIEIDFKPPFQKINFIDKIQELIGEKLPEDLTSYDSIPTLLDICHRHSIHCKPPHTPTRILDEMASHLLEPLCIQPTFIMDHPLAMSPLAKIHRSNNQRTERFELFVGGKELVNAYSELNDPKEQRKRFLAQSQDRIEGDEEAQILDEQYCNALELGLPPTAGWGLGIDRLCMLFSNTPTIKDVILFPTTKPLQSVQQQQQQASQQSQNKSK